MRPELLVLKRRLRFLEDAYLVRRCTANCCKSSTCDACQELLANLQYLHKEILEMRGKR